MSPLPHAATNAHAKAQAAAHPPSAHGHRAASAKAPADAGADPFAALLQAVVDAAPAQASDEAVPAAAEAGGQPGADGDDAQAASRKPHTDPAAGADGKPDPQLLAGWVAALPRQLQAPAQAAAGGERAAARLDDLRGGGHGRAQPAARGAGAPAGLAAQAATAQPDPPGTLAMAGPDLAAPPAGPQPAAQNMPPGLEALSAAAAGEGRRHASTPEATQAGGQAPGLEQAALGTSARLQDTPPTYLGELASRPDQPAFARELASQVEVMLGGRMDSAELRLNPAELGPIHIHLHLTEQTADIRFAAAHDATREGIARGLDELRDMLASQGLNLGQAQVGGGQDQPAWGREAPRPATSGGRPWGEAVDDSPRPEPMRQAMGMLDLYA